MSRFDEKHLPQSTSELVFAEQHVRELILGYAEGKYDRNLLLSGPTGSGKSEAARIILRSRVPDTKDPLLTEVFHGQATDGKFCEKVWSKFDYQSYNGMDQGCIVIDEVDRMTKPVSEALRALMDSTRRITFIATTNYPDRLEPAFRDRFRNVQINRPSNKAWIERATQIINDEGYTLPPEDVLTVLESARAPTVRARIDAIEELIEAKNQEEAMEMA